MAPLEGTGGYIYIYTSVAILAQGIPQAVWLKLSSLALSLSCVVLDLRLVTVTYRHTDILLFLILCYVVVYCFALPF